MYYFIVTYVTKDEILLCSSTSIMLLVFAAVDSVSEHNTVCIQ